MTEVAANDRNIHIVDDDDAIRASLSMLFQSVGINSVAHETGDAFVDWCERHAVQEDGCVILDVRMPGLSGIEVHQYLMDNDINIPVVFVTGHGDIPMAVKAMRDGAFDFLQKPYRDQELLDCVNMAVNKAKDDAKSEAAIGIIRERYETLTEREREVMTLVSTGLANKVIAMDLELSQRTVEIHRARVMEKMQVRSLADLVRIAVQLEI